MSDFISVTDAAQMLNVTAKTVRLWAAEERISARRVGSQWRILKSAVYGMLGSVAKKSTEESASLPHDHDTHNRWMRDHRPTFRTFVFDHLSSFRPDHVVLVDRKGRLYDTLKLIPADLADKVVYPSALTWMWDRSILEGKRVAILEESIQRGSNLGRLRSKLEAYGAEVLSLTLLRRRSIFEAGEALEPQAIACLDLSETEFARATAEVSSVLQSDVICLDVDHFPACEIQVSGETSFELMASALGELGQLLILPAPDPRLKVRCFTVDNPRFFDWEKLRLPESFISEGVVKLRVYFDYRNDPASLFIVPVIYPSANLSDDDIERIAHVTDEIWSRYIILPDRWDQFDSKAKAELLYRSLVIFCSFQLLLQALPFLHGLATELGLDITREGLKVSDQGLARTFGQLETADLSNDVRTEVLTTWQKITRSTWWPSLPSLPTKADYANICFDVPDDGKDIEKLLKVFATFARAADPTAGMSRTELLKELGWAPDRLSRAFDFALDRGLLKPMVEIREDQQGHCVCIRSYRATEYGSWFRNSEAYTPERRAAKRISFIIPYVLDRLMSKGGKLENGVNDMLRDKVFTNLQHDWDLGTFDRLYLGWEPHFFGPMPFVPEISRPSGGYQSIGHFAMEQGVCELVDSPSGGKKKVLVPKANAAWKDHLIDHLGPIERDFLEGLIDVYHDIYHTFEESGDPLVTLAACSNGELTYICAYQDMVLWRETIERVLNRIALNMTSDDPGMLTKLIEDAAKARVQVEEKLQRYERLGEARDLLRKRLKDSTRPAIAEHILNRIEVGELSEQEPYPLGRLRNLVPLMASITSLVHFVAFKYGMAVEKRTASHRDRDAGFYLGRLMDAFPDLVNEELVAAMAIVDKGQRDPVAVEQLTKLYQRAISMIGRHVGDPKDYDEQDFPRDHAIRNVLQAAAKMEDRKETGILLTDISRFVHTATLMAEVNNTSKDDAARELRNNVKEELTRRMDELDLTPKALVPVGGDGWIIADDNVEALVDLACRMHRSKVLRGQPFKSTITFGTPGTTNGGPALGQGFIRAYYLMEKSGMMEGGIRVADEAAQKVGSEDLVKLFERLEEPVDLKSFGKCVAHDVNWRQYGEGR
jgi:excisionase family DNA binding protein